jgi:hypothetical protein
MMRSYKIRTDNEDTHVAETDITILSEEGSLLLVHFMSEHDYFALGALHTF